MFRFFITSLFLSTISCGCAQQLGLGKHQTEDTAFGITLPEYDANPCVKEVLEIIALSDSNTIRFPTDLYCYEVMFSDFITYRQIVITPSRWQKSLPKDCKGIILVQGVYFLLYFNNSGSLFIKKDNEITRNIVRVKSNHFDSLDAQVKWTDWTNSPTAIVGEYRSCPGVPINLHLNNGLNLKSLLGKQEE